MTVKPRAQKKDFFLYDREKEFCLVFFFNFMKLLVKTIINKSFPSIRANDVFNKFRAALRFTKY